MTRRPDGRRTDIHGEVSITVAADPGKIFALITDVTRVGELSPETFEAEWLDGATGASVGARFRGHVRRNGRGPVYWTQCTVVECDRDRAFTFTVDVGGRVVNRWSYRLRQVDGGTEVTESFALTPTPLTRAYWAVAGRRRGRTNRAGMQATLARVKAIAEAG